MQFIESVCRLSGKYITRGVLICPYADLHASCYFIAGYSFFSIVNGLLFLLSVEAHKIQADNYKRHAEPLSHIECHTVFKVHLVFFQEFDEEAENKDFGKTQPEEKAPVIGLLPFIQIHHTQEEKEMDVQ